MNKVKYNIHRAPVFRNLFQVKIIGDVNDADYITTIEYYSVNDFNEHIADALIDLLKNASNNYELEDYYNDWLNIPFIEDRNCHSLEDVEVIFFDKNGVGHYVDINY